MPFFLIEIAVFILFLTVVVLARRLGRLGFLLYATGFAFIFENLNVWLFANHAGGYFYNPAFKLFILHTPVFIGLSWGILLLSSYLVARGIFGSWHWSVIFAVPLLTTMVDLAMEAVAVNLNFWTWIGFENAVGLARVAPSNFIGWLAVSFGFILSYELLKNKTWSLIAGYPVFLFIAGGAAATGQLLGLAGLSGYWLLIILIIINMMSLAWALCKRPPTKPLKIKNKFEYWIILPRYAFYAFAILAGVWQGLYHDWIVTTIIILISSLEIYIFIKFIWDRNQPQ